MQHAVRHTKWLANHNCGCSLPHYFKFAWVSCSISKQTPVNSINWSYRLPPHLNLEWLTYFEYKVQTFYDTCFFRFLCLFTPNHIPLKCRCPKCCCVGWTPRNITQQRGPSECNSRMMGAQMNVLVKIQYPCTTFQASNCYIPRAHWMSTKCWIMLCGLPYRNYMYQAMFIHFHTCSHSPNYGLVHIIDIRTWTQVEWHFLRWTHMSW